MTVTRFVFPPWLPWMPETVGGRKAPLHENHLFWRCAVAGCASKNVTVPSFDVLVDHSGHVVLICDLVVADLGL